MNPTKLNEFLDSLIEVLMQDVLFYIPEEMISEYLVPNIYIEYGISNSLYYLNTIDSEDYLGYDPYFTCSSKFVRLLIDL